MLNTEQFKDYVELYEEKQELEADLKNVKERLAEYDSDLVDSLLDNDMQKISIAGKTCYIKTTRYAKITNKHDAIRILKEARYDDYIKEGYNANSVSKLVRDLMDEEGELPEQFGEVITVGERTQLGVTNA